ncbi:argininosuccinate lyase [Coriobacteriales bacterium OH1046]|nr:argininosuccinate lyase [Coriobacteriales bacterium OH1046]
MALWSGRFEENTSNFALTWGASLETDKAMAEHDIAGSLAHARMLSEQGIISEEDFSAIEAGLDRILGQIQNGTFAWDGADEDIHMAVERALIADIGPAGARLHTGRSRNDQVATDIRLLAKELADDLLSENRALRDVLLDTAEKHVDAVMPGYTHLQHAQPVLLSHHLLAYFWMLTRDHTRLAAAYDAADENPLGAAALAGTSYPLDRERTTELLDFSATIPNSLDAVSDRDYLLDLEYACAVSMMHLSRLCEEIVLWSSSEFGFITLSDAWSTGSSIMPQKKNPDFAELTRGKTGRVVGDLVSLLVTCKGLPLAYNKDLQECKEGALDAADTLLDCYVVMKGMLATMSVHRDRMAAAARAGFTAATDVADYLAKKGMPFREAHAVVGQLVLSCEKRGCGLEDLSLDDLRAASGLFEADILGTLDPESIANARTTYGGTALDAVLIQLEEAREVLEADYLW